MTVDPGPEDTPYEYITMMAEKNRRSILGDPAERPSDAQHLSTRLSQLYAGDGVTHLGSWETCHAMIGMSLGAILGSWETCHIGMEPIGLGTVESDGR